MKVNELLTDLLEIGDLYVMGGALREFRDGWCLANIRDLDICMDIHSDGLWIRLLQKYQHTINRFGGYKFMCDDFKVDVWDVRNTWAFKQGLIDVSAGDYFEKLPQSVFLNLDAICYDLKNNRWNDSIYVEAMETRVLDIVLQENPCIYLNILRSMVLRRTYGMAYSDKLVDVIHSRASYGLVDNLMMIQERRYGRCVLCEKVITEELMLCGYSGVEDRYNIVIHETAEETL